MFVQKGYEGTTMRAIAGKIGYTPTAIYHHFKDKDALVAELAGLDFRALAQALQQTGTVGDPLERLEKVGAAYVEFGLTHPMQYQFLFMTRRPKGGAPGGMSRDPGEDAYGFLRQTCAAVIATGRLRPELPVDPVAGRATDRHENPGDDAARFSAGTRSVIFFVPVVNSVMQYDNVKQHRKRDA